MPRNPKNPKPGSKTVPAPLTAAPNDALPPVVRERKPRGPRSDRPSRAVTVDDGADETPSRYPLWVKIVLVLIVGYVLADWWVRRSYTARIIPADDRPTWREQLAERQRQEELRVVREERNSVALDRIAGALDAIVKDAKSS